MRLVEGRRAKVEEGAVSFMSTREGTEGRDGVEGVRSGGEGQIRRAEAGTVQLEPWRSEKGSPRKAAATVHGRAGEVECDWSDTSYPPRVQKQCQPFLVLNFL